MTCAPGNFCAVMLVSQALDPESRLPTKLDGPYARASCDVQHVLRVVADGREVQLSVRRKDEESVLKVCSGSDASLFSIFGSSLTKPFLLLLLHQVRQQRRSTALFACALATPGSPRRWAAGILLSWSAP